MSREGSESWRNSVYILMTGLGQKAGPKPGLFLRGRERQVMEQSFSAEGAEQLWGGPPAEQEKGCGTGSCPRLALLGLCPSKAAGMGLD